MNTVGLVTTRVTVRRQEFGDWSSARWSRKDCRPRAARAAPSLRPPPRGQGPFRADVHTEGTLTVKRYVSTNQPKPSDCPSGPFGFASCSRPSRLSAAQAASEQETVLFLVYTDSTPAGRTSVNRKRRCFLFNSQDTRRKQPLLRMAPNKARKQHPLREPGPYKGRGTTPALSNTNQHV